MKDGEKHLAPDALEHYNADHEAARLEHGPGLLEAARTRELLERFLPAAPARILDIGGGTGVHALPLARKGNEVHLVDATPLHVERARAASEAQSDAPLASVALGDVRRLAAADESFDAVLALGPFYHLQDRADRLQGLREIRRVLRPGGVMLAAAISRGASLLSGITEGFLPDPVFDAIVTQDLATGCHENGGNPSYFATAYFHDPDELESELVEAGFVFQALLAIEGPCWLAKDFDRAWADEVFRGRLMARAREVEADPRFHAISPHLMAVGRVA